MFNYLHCLLGGYHIKRRVEIIIIIYLEQKKKLVERKERSHRLIVKGAEFEKAFSLSKDLEQEDVQKVMSQLKISGYNRGAVRNVSNAAEKIGRQQIAEAVKKTEKGDDS